MSSDLTREEFVCETADMVRMTPIVRKRGSNVRGIRLTEYFIHTGAVCYKKQVVERGTPPYRVFHMYITPPARAIDMWTWGYRRTNRMLLHGSDFHVAKRGDQYGDLFSTLFLVREEDMSGDETDEAE